jgi:redox-sensitive bicupin YhaK (pirin superfamily)
MIDIRPHGALGVMKEDWLDSRFHFSFAGYRDDDRMGHGALRVWNDDIIAPHSGFGMHPHRDMEIVTYVRTGATTHEDSLGNRGRTEAGDVQVMSAGTGITHAEYNEEDAPTTLFQIWIIPDRRGYAPGWATRRFPDRAEGGALTPLASGRAAHADSNALPIHQDAALFGARLAAGDTVRHALEPGRKAYLVAAEGAITVNGIPAARGDGVAVSDEAEIAITATAASEIVLVDAP